MAAGTTETLTDVEQSAPVGALTGGPALRRSSSLLPPVPRATALGRAPVCTEPPWRVSAADPPLRKGVLPVAPGGNPSAAYRRAKRLLDVVGALGLLLVLGPIMLAVFLILLVTTRGRPLFWQSRAGYCGRPFLMLKFRTMVLDAARRQHEVPNEQDGPIFKNRRDPRITRLGCLLRRTSLDETPQLFHVLFGRMSLVGPRPLPLAEVARLEAWQRRRLAVMPGLTCLWQIAGRSEIGFDEWMRLDLWYVRNQSLRTDLKLLWRTPACVLAGHGAY
jgi:lipopolysaccharide/colanic/teichoic acid biosynthesis glycosyltransferase